MRSDGTRIHKRASVALALFLAAVASSGVAACSQNADPRLVTDHAAPPGKADILPMACLPGLPPLEPSGLTKFEGRLLFVSDNRQDVAIYEVFPDEKDEKGCRSAVFIPLKSEDLAGIPKRHALDLEGIEFWAGNFYVVDERDRFIYRVDLNGGVEQVRHDIPEYNLKHGIVFSEDPNAAFEGIAIDPAQGIFYIANEREDPIIYVLRQTSDALVLETERHVPMKDVLGGRSPDISDLCFDGGALYVLHRIANRILRLDPGNMTVTGVFDFSSEVAGLYTSRHGYGFAEGLHLTQDLIYLLLDSNGTPIAETAVGFSGALVILDRPADF
jgi:hypothetical protein